VLPNLIVAGAGKSGTSSLHLYLDQHPDIVMTTTKEPHVFTDPERLAHAQQIYAELFPPAAASSRYRGESSTGYMVFPGVPDRIHAAIPDCRLIFLLRNPIDRALSHYRWLISLGAERRDFRTVFESDRADVPDPRSSPSGNYGYLYQEGCYATNLARFIPPFRSDQTLLLVAEELRADPLTCLNRCAAFLGLPGFTAVTPVAANETRSLRYPRVRARLEGRLPGSASTPHRVRAAVRKVVGERRARALRDAAVASLGSTEVDVPINVDRSWLAGIYAAEVAALRARDPDFTEVWLADFPL